MIIHNARFYLEDSFANDVKALRVENGSIVELLSTLPAGLSPMISIWAAIMPISFIDTHTVSGGLYSGHRSASLPDISSSSQDRGRA